MPTSYIKARSGILFVSSASALLFVNFLLLTPRSTLAASCEVKLMFPRATIQEQYTGGCKNGMANGRGKYSFSMVSAKTNEKIVTTVTGAFANGELSGDGKLAGSNGAWEVGNYASGKRVNVNGVTLDGNVRVGYFYIDGKQVGLCRSDKSQPQCTQELMATLNGTPTLLASSKVGAGSSKSAESSAGANSSAGNMEKIAANLCRPGVPAGGGYRNVVESVKVFPPVDAASLTGRDQLGVNTGKAYPVKISGRMEITYRTSSKKDIVPWRREGFVYKDAFGDHVCKSKSVG